LDFFSSPYDFDWHGGFSSCGVDVTQSLKVVIPDSLGMV
jgi:hypothetical protein